MVESVNSEPKITLNKKEQLKEIRARKGLGKQLDPREAEMLEKENARARKGLKKKEAEYLTDLELLARHLPVLTGTFDIYLESRKVQEALDAGEDGGHPAHLLSAYKAYLRDREQLLQVCAEYNSK